MFHKLGQIYWAPLAIYKEPDCRKTCKARICLAEKRVSDTEKSPKQESDQLSVILGLARRSYLEHVFHLYGFQFPDLWNQSVEAVTWYTF